MPNTCTPLDVPPLAWCIRPFLRPAVLVADLVNDPAHSPGGEIDGETPAVIRGSGPCHPVGVVRMLYVVPQVVLLRECAVARRCTKRVEMNTEATNRFLVHRIPRRCRILAQAT